MTHITDSVRAVSIGDASRRTGVPVRTIRFYCDEQLLPAHRTSGGHRVFTEETLNRLTSIQRLRALGLGLTVIAAILADEDATRSAVAAERVSVEAQLDALSWRHAVLLAFEETCDEDRPGTLARLAGVAEPGAARDVLVGFWRRVLAAMPPGLFDEFVAMDIPALPATPTPGHVNLFVAAHAAARGRRDTPAFRRRLAAGATGHPAVTRYWLLTARALGTPHTTGATQEWLHTALGRSLEPRDG